jgi:hypothetical protein
LAEQDLLASEEWIAAGIFIRPQTTEFLTTIPETMVATMRNVPQAFSS